MTIKIPAKAAMYGKNIKSWGWTQSVLVTETSHVAVAHINKGGYSSKHLHKNNWNRFVVLSGKLRIDLYRNDKEETIDLISGDVLDVEPGLKHRMTALEDTKLVEIYWSSNGEFNVEDIERDDNGGLKNALDEFFRNEKFKEEIKSWFGNRQELPS